MAKEGHIYTEDELQLELARRRVTNIVCESSARVFPMLSWVYYDGTVTINTLTHDHLWGNDFVTRSVKTVHARSIQDGSSSEMACYNLVKALIPTGVTSAAIGSLDLGNQQQILGMLRELVEAHMILDKEEREEAIAKTQASKLARHINWGDSVE